MNFGADVLSNDYGGATNERRFFGKMSMPFLNARSMRYFHYFPRRRLCGVLPPAFLCVEKIASEIHPWGYVIVLLWGVQ